MLISTLARRQKKGDLNMEVVRQYYRAIAQRDMTVLRTCMSNEAVLIFGEIELCGIDAIMHGYQEFLNSMTEYSPDIKRIVTCDDTVVVVEGLARGRNIGQEKAFSVPFASVFDLHGGKIVAQHDYFDPSRMMPNG